MQSKHSRLAPSKAKQWINCAGSITLCDKVPERPSSPYANEGTAAHELAKDCLEQGKLASNFKGKIYVVEDQEFEVNEDMIDAVQTYLAVVRADTEEAGKKAEVLIEKTFDLSWLHPDIGGTTDYAIIDRVHKKLKVYDYKHGAGIRVEVEWNPQAMLYALGALYVAWDVEEWTPVTEQIEEIEIVIVQPRAHHIDGPVRRWTISTSGLLYWGLNVLKPAALDAGKVDAPLSPGAHCDSSFCNAMAVCPAHAEMVTALAKTDFHDPVLPNPDELTVEQISKLIENSGSFKNWHGKVMAHAFNLANNGTKIPGFKLVKSSKNRKWKKGAEDKLRNVLGDEAFQEKLLGITKIEALLKKKGMSVEAELDGTWEKPEGEVIMVPLEDKRDEVPPPNLMMLAEDDDFLE